MSRVLAPESNGPLTAKAADAPATLSPLQPAAGGGWRIEWTTTPGVQYRLDAAPRLVSPPAWSPLVTLSATGSVLRYDDRALGAQRFYRVATESGSGPLQIGKTPIVGTITATNTLGWVLPGPVQAGVLTLPTGDPTIIDSTRQQLTGNGPVSVPGLGVVVQGAFTLDLATGKLTGPAAPAAEAGPGVTVAFHTVEIDVLTGKVSGDGVARVNLDRPAAAGDSSAQLHEVATHTAPATAEVVCEGRLEWDPTSRTFQFTGRATFREVTLDGSGAIRTSDATLDLSGVLGIPGSSATAFTFSNARFTLERPADGEPRIALGGRSTLAALDALSVRLEGVLTRGGALRLSGSGAGNIDALRFTRLDVVLERGSAAGAAALLRFNGPLELPRVGGSALAGRLLPDGSLTNVVATEPIRFGSLEIRPRAGGPVLSLRSSTASRQTFVVRGEFQAPSENGTQPVEVTGPLVLVSNGAALDVESMHLTNALPMAHWPMPAGLRLTNAAVLLSLTNADFEARLRGSLVITRTPQASTTLSLDAALSINVDDIEDIAIDTAIRVQNLPMLGKAWWRDATFRVQSGSKPPRGALGVSGGALGLLPYEGRPGSGAVTRDDFRLFVEDVGAGFAFVGDTFSAYLTNGTLRLPTLFTNQPAGLCPDQRVASVGLGRNTAITLEFTPLPTPDLTLRAIGSLDFRNLTFTPGSAEFGVELCRASLAFNPGGLPYFTNLQGSLKIALPPGQTSRVDLIDGAWELDGWPSGTIALMSRLSLYEGHGMAFTLLPRGTTNCGSGTALTVLPGDGLQPRRLQLSGGIEVSLPADLVTEVSGDTVRGIACGTLILDPRTPLQPQLLVSNLAVGGSFHLGGESGLLITNGLLSLQNLHNAFALGPESPVVVRVGGTVAVGSLPSFTLNDARFIFFSPDRPPRFDIAGLGFDEREFQIAKKVPARITKGSFTFHNRELPLPHLLHPTNLNLTFSTKIALPTTSDPMYESSADDVKIDINEKGAPIFKGLNGVSMALRALKIPPIEDIGGMLTAWGLGGLTGGASNPGLHEPGVSAPPSSAVDLDDLFLAGRVVGSYQGYKVNLIIALRPNGMVGACVDANFGAVGIPLDGYALGGILLTGASGGIAFGKGFVDPCEFTQYLDASGKPKPGVTELPTITLDWEDLRKKIAKAEAKAEGFAEFIYDHTPGTAASSLHGTTASAPAPAPAAALAPAASLASAPSLPHARSTNEFGLPCPGNCPPPTMNLFCQPHPDQQRFPGRVIARFSSIDESTLAALGFTRDAVRARFAQGSDTVGLLSQDLSLLVSSVVSSQTTRPDPAALGPEAAELDAWIEKSLAELRASLVDLIREHITGQTQADQVHQMLVDLAYGGVPCLDLTLTMSGTLTHSVVSSFLSGTVGATVTTAGSAGVSGRVNVLGVPIGRAKGFISATDEGGDPNPSLCGQIDVSVGPLDLGSMRASYALDGGVTGFTRAFQQLVACVGEPLFVALVTDVAPRIPTRGRSKSSIAADLTTSEKIGLMAQLYSRSDLPGELRGCFRTALASIAADVQPEILLCGQVQPRLFGFDLGPSLVEAGMHVTKEKLTAIQSYSPSYLLAVGLISAGSAASGGTIGIAAGPLATALFAQDRATYGMAYAWPDPLEPFLGGLDGRFSTPQGVAQYLDRGFDAFVANATHTFAYSLSPLGFKTVDTQMRLVLPNLTAHPARPGSTWIRPELRPNLNLPSRLDLAVSALTNHLAGSSLGLLADPQWKGTAADLGEAFGNNAAARAKVSGLSFADDYFPHGGLLGGAYIQIPRALYEAPAPVLTTALSPTNDILTRLVAAVSWVQDYVLQSRQAGALGFYMPAPNPPFFTDSRGQPLTPRALFDGIMSRDPDSFGSPGVLAASEMFLRGWLDGQLLGVPLVQASLDAALGDPRTATGPYFRAQGRVPSGSWLDAFSPGARVEFDLSQAPARPMDEVFREQLERLNAAIASGSTAERQRVLEAWLAGLSPSMPRVKMELELPLQMPAPIREIASFTGGTWLYAYSPRFEPGFEPLNNLPRARARRDGGLAFRGALELRAQGATLVSIPSAELSVLPKASGLPALSGAFDAALVPFGPLTLRQTVVQFTTDPAPAFSVRGSLDPVRISALTLESPTGGSVTGRLEVSRPAAGGTRTALALSPAQARILNATLRIHGARTDSDFEFRTDGPWTASATPAATARYGVAGTDILQIDASVFPAPLTVSGTGTTAVAISGELAPGARVTLFPGRADALAVTLAASPRATFVLRQDGTFALEGTTASELSLAGFPGSTVAAVRSGSRIRVTPEGVTFEGLLGGGVLEAAGGLTFSASGRVTIARNGTPEVALTTALAVGPWIDRQFRIEGISGGALSATLAGSTLQVAGGRFVIDQVVTQSFGPFPLDRAGNLSLSFGPSSLALGGVPLAQAQFRVTRTNGTLRVDEFRASAALPGLSPSLDLRGRLTSDGSIALSNRLATATLAGLPTGAFDWSLRRDPESWVAAVSASNPRAWWSLNETKSLTASNRITAKLDGTYSGAITLGESAAIAYPGNRAPRFSKDAAVVVGTQPDFNTLGPALTVEAWIRVGTFDRAWNTIASRGDNSWRLQRDGTRRALGFDTDGVSPPYLAGTRAVDDGQWHHVVATYDGRAKALYIDGELDAWTAATGTVASSTYPVVIGENAQSTGRFWNGWIDEVALYNRALSPDEVIAHHRAGGGFETRARTQLAVPGLGNVEVAGSFGPSGSFDLAATAAATLAPGGFALQQASVRALRLGNAPATVLLLGTLNVPNLVSANLAGQYTPASGFDLTGSSASGDFAGINLANVAFQLRTAAGLTALNATGQLQVPVLGSLAVQGAVSSDGTFSLANTSLPGNSLFGFPVNSWVSTLRHAPGAYAAGLAGDPLVPADRGADPVAYWRLADASGTTAADRKKSSLARPLITGTYTGGVRLGEPSGLTGPLNRDTSVFLDGVDDFIAIGSESAFDFTRSLSIEAWIRVASWSKAWQAIITKGDNAWRLSRFGTTGRISFETTSGGVHHSLEGGPDLNDNRWHHVVATYNGQAKALYIDGSLEAFAAYDRELDRNDWPVQLGANAQVAGRNFHGGLDEVALYGRELTPGEVIRHYLDGGGTGVTLTTRLAVPGVQATEVTGLLHPRGAASLQATFPTLTAGGFTLRNGQLAVARTTAGTALAQLQGSLSTEWGALPFAGSLEPSGAYSLFTAPTGSLILAGSPFTYAAPLKLTPTQWEGAGSLAFGNFNLAGNLKVPSKGLASFSGSVSGTTQPKAFGKTVSGKPGHPYAWVSWVATGTYDATARTLRTSVAGTLTVEYEAPPGKYSKKNFGFGPVNLGVDGSLVVNPGETFSGVSSFGFTLP